jgi:glycosyltransferase involved in cell wall biosynthesis
MSARRVLHVLPHAGAGAQTYIDVLMALDGYEFAVFELSGSRGRAAAATAIATRQPRLARAARSADIVHVHGEVASLASLPWLRLHASVVTLHGMHLTRRLPERAGQAAARVIVAAADATICVSQAERDELEHLPWRLRLKLAVVRNGLALPPPVAAAPRAAARAALALSGDDVAVLYLGQLEPRKDPGTLVRAAGRAHAQDGRIVLLIAGQGPSAAELRALAGPEVRLLGQRRDAGELLAAADVFVMPSRREGLSYAVLEALAHGVATIVSDAPGNPEAVGEAGLVFPAGREEALAAILVELAADPGRRAALAASGRDRIATELSAERMLAGTRAIYEHVLTAPARGAGAARA